MTINFKAVKKFDLTKEKCVAFVAEKASDLDSYEFLAEHQNRIESKFNDKKNTIVTIFNNDNTYFLVLLAESKVNRSDYNEDLRGLGASLNKLMNAEKIKSGLISFESSITELKSALAFVEGIELENYQFLNYKTKKNKNSLSKVSIHGAGITQADLNELSAVCSSVELARDLVNEPVITLTAKKLSKEITKAGKSSGFTTKVLDKEAITKLGMGGLLGVNAGSIDPPTFNILEWKPAKAVNKKPIVLVGKGVVYDTGGNNLKPGSFMSTMKADMGGSAAVVGTMNAIALNKLPLHVIGLIPATDNRIGKNAIVADDILKMYDGSTVEVQNTDAEGRLILADALAYAKQYKPELVIDLATLTGAASAIVGTFGIAMMGTADKDEKLRLSESGDKVYERIAEMPYWREYNDLLKSDIADIKNIGGPTGGAITAGKFLEHFTDYPWIHLDIAGPAFLTKAEKYKPIGGTGVGIRLLYDFLKQKAAS